MKAKMKNWKYRAAAQLSDYHNMHLVRAATLHAEHHAFLEHRLYHHKQDLGANLNDPGVNVVFCCTARVQVLQICQALLFIPI
jgi:hypothetical protein